MAESTQLPDVASVKKDPPVHPSTVTITFENGARLRYSRRDEAIHEDIFAPNDTNNPATSTIVSSGAASVENIATGSLDRYDRYDTVSELRDDWESLAEWICHE